MRTPKIWDKDRQTADSILSANGGPRSGRARLEWLEKELREQMGEYYRTIQDRERVEDDDGPR